MLANVLVLQKRPEAAIQRIDQQINRFPSQAALYELLGQWYQNQKNYAKAEEAYRKAMSLDKNRLTPYSLLGQLFMIQNAADRAKAEFSNILKINPRSVEAHVMLGMIEQMKQAPDQAQSHYREALKLDPQSPIAANNLAWLLAESGQNLDEALGLAQIAKGKLPKDLDVLDTAGWVYYKTGAFRPALDLFKQCVKQDSKNALFHYHLGVTYLKVGDRENARLSLNQAIRLDPGFPGVEDAKKTLAKL